MFLPFDDCPADDGLQKLALGIFILLGLLISYIPQIIKLSQASSSEGLSLWFLLLGALGCFSTFGNVVLLQSPAFECCISMWSPFTCFQNVLGVVQIATQLICFLTICVLFYRHFPEHAKWIQQEQDEETESISNHRISPQWREALFVAKFLYFYGGFVVLTIIVLVTMKLMHLLDWNFVISIWAGFLGLFATCTGFVQFVPQIIHTAAEKKAGALSILMMAIQCPGSFVFAAALSIQPGTNWTSWISFVVSGTLQGVLLCMCIYFEYFKTPSDATGETSPLLAAESEASTPVHSSSDDANAVFVEDEEESLQ